MENAFKLSLLNFNDLTFSPFIVVNEKRIEPKKFSQICNDEIIHLRYTYDETTHDDFYICKKGSAYTCKRYFCSTEKNLQLNELGIDFAEIYFNKNPAKDYFYHNENPRIYEKMGILIDYDRVTGGNAPDTGFDEEAGNRWADPGVVHERIGRSPYQPFPAILLSNYETKNGLVHGTLSQKLFYHNYLVKHKNEQVILSLFSSFKAIKYLDYKAGRVLIDEWYLGSTDKADDLEEIFASYVKELRKHLPPLYGATKINRDNMVWGSWNDGITRNISDEMILKEAVFLKKNFPMVRWIQVDDGYAVHTPPAHGLGMPYEGEAGVDSKKFPEGMRAYSDKIRKIGLRPATWIGGFCPKKTPIYQEKPEWFFDYDYRTPASAPLDLSLTEVREYVVSALDVFFGKYAFEGMKHDFWSYAFEDSHDLLKNKEKSGYELRSWWLQEIRKRIPNDAYLQTGCDIVMGNPFLAEYFTNYRYGIDIGGGNWDYVKTNFLWGIACFATHTSDLFVANSDSVGLFPGLNDTEAMFCLNYCLVTHSMVEIAGKLSEAKEDCPRLKALKKACCNPNNGQEIFLAKYNYRDNANLIPRILYFKTAHFSTIENNESLPLRSIGLFNVEDKEIEIEFEAQDLGLPEGNYLLTNVWTTETSDFAAKIKVRLPARGSMLLAVNKNKAEQFLDANLKIEEYKENTAIITYGGEAEFFFSSEVKKIVSDNNEISFKCCKNSNNYKVRFTAKKQSKVKFYFKE